MNKFASFLLSAASAFTIPTPNNIIHLQERPTLSNDDMVSAGLVATFTDSFFTTYNAQFISLFTQKMHEIEFSTDEDEFEIEGSANSHCSELQNLRLGPVSLCISN